MPLLIRSLILLSALLAASTLAAQCPLPPSHPAFCTACGPCSEGEGGCRGDDQCAAGLVCVENFGALFDRPRTVDVCAVPRSLGEPSFTLAEVIPPSTPGDLDRLEVVGLDDAGRVAGTAFDTNGRSVAFRRVPGEDPETVTPLPGFDARAVAIHRDGAVFGIYVGQDIPIQRGFFLLQSDGLVDILAEGATELLRRRLDFVDMNVHGEILGNSRRPANGRLTPYLYTPAEGWIDLSALDPSFPGMDVEAMALNDRGDVVLMARPSPGVTDAYILRGDELFEIENGGSRRNIPRFLGENGHLVGVRFPAGRSEMYFLPQPGARPISLQPPRFRESFAAGVTRKGIVGGLYADAVVLDRIFTWDRRRQRRIQLQTSFEDFQRFFLLQIFFDLNRVRMNERLEFVGSAVFINFAAQFVEHFFYFSPLHGAHDVDVLLANAGASEEERVIELVDLNNWGALLLRTEDPDSIERVVVLMPGE